MNLRFAKSWPPFAIAIFVIYAIAPFVFGKHLYGLSIFGDLMQLVLGLLLVALYTRNYRDGEDRIRQFWKWLAISVLFWTTGQIIYSYNEIFHGVSSSF